MPSRRSEVDRAKYWELRNERGFSQVQAAKEIGIAVQTARAWERGLRNDSGDAYRSRLKEQSLQPPKRFHELSKEAKLAYDDFACFRRRYFGRLSSPWQEDAGYKFAELLKTDKREYVVLNCPPGAGKSKLLMDIEAWMTFRNRAIRGIIGSATQKKADAFTRALKRELERIVPLRGEPAEVAAGRAFDAITTMAADAGRFQPDQSDVWRGNEFVVAQLGDIAISEKESTWQSFGLDGDYLGNRVDLSVWDDVVTEKTLKTIERIMDQRRKWDKEVETRLEPEGLLALVMQRKGPEDLSRHCLDKLGGDDEIEDEDEQEDHIAIVEPEGSAIARKYHHFKYPAHDDSRCQGLHSRKDPRYWAPNDAKGCLLDPIRLSYGDLQGFQRTDGEDYLVTYQQEEIDPASTLINRLWITGGTDPHTGEHYFGCYDKDRGMMQLPPIEGEVYSTLAVDPSGVNFWGLIWSCYAPDTELRYLMNADSRKMTSSQFLDWDYDKKEWTGVLEMWWQDSLTVGRPIRNLIFEQNAAQRYFGQSNTFNRWCQVRGVSYYPHNTNDSNKNSKELGVQSIAPHFRYGRWRLPNNQNRGDYGFVASSKLVDELCVYPRGMRTDLVMATWMTEFWLPRIVVPKADNLIRPDVPQWLGTGAV